MSNYPWLQDRKMQAMRKRKKSQRNLYPYHAGYNRDIEFTGIGNPNDVSMHTPSGPVHKNEMIFNGPGNGSVITDAVTSNELMSNPVINDRVQGYKRGGYSKSGYQKGGYVSPNVVPNIHAPNVDTPVSPTIDRVGLDARAMREKGIRGIEDIYEKGSIAGRVAGSKQLTDLKSTQDVERQVLKQELAQRGIKGTQATGQLARLRGEHEGALAETEAQIGIEQLQARERAAQQLAEEGARQADIEMSNRQFEEFVRQFDVGSEQWNEAFEERRRQFDVGSEQWNQTFEEQRRQFEVGDEQWNKSFDEQRRQFEVGSSQWERSFQNQRKLQWEQFEEQKHQFDVGSDQWDRAHEAQKEQWAKSFEEQRRQFDVGTSQWIQTFNEERRRYAVDDKKWWASFDEQRRQAVVGEDQWNRSFYEQQRQFEVGSEQWNKVQKLKEKEFQRALNMDKHTVDVWKNNVSHRDRAYADNLSMEQQRLQMERDVHEKNMKMIDFKLNAAEDSEKTRRYWEASQKMYNYATTHIDGFNEETGEFTSDAELQMFDWFKSKYPDSGVSGYNSPQEYEQATGDKGFRKRFKMWASSEWRAATDDRLTNPFDKMLYTINTSDLSDEAKKVAVDFLSSPDGLAGIMGIEIDEKTGTIKIKPKTITKGPQDITEPSGNKNKPNGNPLP